MFVYVKGSGDSFSEGMKALFELSRLVGECGKEAILLEVLFSVMVDLKEGLEDSP